MCCGIIACTFYMSWVDVNCCGMQRQAYWKLASNRTYQNVSLACYPCCATQWWPYSLLHNSVLQITMAGSFLLELMQALLDQHLKHFFVH